jgi:hypothetical protein
MASSFNDLIAYFENLARRHVDIQHSESEKHFFRMEIDEVLAGINRTDVKHPYFILEGYSFNFSDNRSDNVLKSREGAFVLLDQVNDPTDYAAIHNAWQRMEAIGDDILVKIKADKRNPLVKAVRDFDFTKVEATLIANEMDGNYGMRFTYSLASPLPTDVDPDKWIPEGSI